MCGCSRISRGRRRRDSAYDPFFAGATTAADFGATARPFGIAAGDVDNDGKVDIVSGRAML